MTLPRIKPGMNTFMGCDVGERRAGYRIGGLAHSIAQTLVLEGFLQRLDIENNRYQWYALTEKGKAHLSAREAYRARI